ncbi:hypothetical protein AVEN_42923-1 [Araneus ventricosus]|uniref:Uncharacterized protein n=1 Tax=Araneus ventricosus TaxID=182803 RepID=A0A4Y2AF54_ARAVE|nr:hypothetical protein AVEN_42923-1 [Araneus ventricosus]
MYHPSNGSPCTANTWGYFAVHEKQEANTAATASHGELPRLPWREGRKSRNSKGRQKPEMRPDTRVPRGRLEGGGGLVTAGESSKSSDMSYSKASSSDAD